MHNRNSQRSIMDVPALGEGICQDNKNLEIADNALREFSSGYITSLLSDFHNKMHMFYSFADFTRDCRTVKVRIKNEGVYFLTTALPALMNDLLIQLEGGDADYVGFRKQANQNYPLFLNRMFEIVKSERYTVLVQAAALDTIYNVSCCFKKLRGSPDVVSHKEQYYEFVATDAEIGAINFSDESLQSILRSASTQWDNFAADISLDDVACVPRPGPGATVDSIQKCERYAPHTMYKTLNDVFPYDEWFYPDMWSVNEESRKYLSLTKAYEPYSEYLLVPKTYVKWRGICKETNEAQFFQQALRRLLAKHIKSKLSKHLPLDDQSVHATLALEASIDRENATIDESEASDRIARLLVSIITSNTPELHDALMAVSTRYIKPPSFAGKKFLLKTHKFAPMGSGVCFPIMSLVHLFLVKAIILCHAHDIPFPDRKALTQRVSVYGDDIVLPSSIVPLVYEWLPKFGMKINQTKSFVKSFFRESCGCHAYKGIDITPVFIKYTNFSSTISDAKQLLSLVAVEADLFKREKFKTAEFLREHIHTKWNNLPYVCVNTPLVGYRRPPSHPDLTDFSKLPKRQVSRRWDRFMHSFKYRLECWYVVKSSEIIKTSTESYMRYQCMAPQRDVSYRWDETGLHTPFSMDEFVNRVDEETLLVSTRRVPMYTSSIYSAVRKSAYV
jgi:hypothetical protein